VDRLGGASTHTILHPKSNGKHPTPALDIDQILIEADGVMAAVTDGVDKLATAMAADVRSELKALDPESRAGAVATIQARVLAADPERHGVLAQLFGIELPATEPAESLLTDTANGERLADRYGGRLRYVKAWGWLVWDGRRWSHDDTGELDRMAKETAKSIYAEAAIAPDEKAADKTAGWARASLQRPRLDAMKSMAQSESIIVARPTDFDGHPLLLNVANGTIDLTTGKLCDHDRDEHLTKIAPVSYDPDAKCELWLDFLYRIFDNNGPLLTFVQRAIGYSLTGDTSEQCLFVLHGSGANGKSTLIETLRALVGEYGQQAEFKTFMEHGSDGPRNDIARMAGARLVAAVESGEGRRLDEPVIKQLTGGDMVAARLLFHEPFEFRPEFKLWLATNHRPTIKGTDDAIWRRIRLIPFKVTIPPAEQDHRMAEKLSAELPGILAWAVRGCLTWQAEGLGAPDIVTQATTGYRAEQDDLAAFLAECCALNPRATAKAADLHATYKAWGGQDNPKEFGLRLKERGFEQDRTTGGTRVWRGVALLAAEDSQ